MVNRPAANQRKDVAVESPGSSHQGPTPGPGNNQGPVPAKDKTIEIFVNGTPHDVPKKEELTYAEVVTLAFPDYPQHPDITYSVTYTRGNGNKPEGTLSPGGSVKAKEGMSFVVTRTGQS
jgi:hypothetical protein